MRRFFARCQAAQLKLFHPPATSPEWQALPPEVRQATTVLLARMLREHRASCAACEGAAEVSDE